jgi:hypothetical protein
MIIDEIDLRTCRPWINVSDYFELRSWAKRFGVTAGAVRRAVARVGDRPKDVEAFLEMERELATGDAAVAGAACPR